MSDAEMTKPCTTHTSVEHGVSGSRLTDLVIGIFRGRDTKVGLDQRADERSPCGTGKLQTRRDSRCGKCGIHQPPRVARHSLSHGGVHGQRQIRTVPSYLVFCLSFLSASPAFAQGQTGSIAGVVSDATGAVLPGVTVEASSPALIEKVAHRRHRRSGRIQDRRPAARHLQRDLHADRLQHRQARRHRADHRLHRQRQRRHAGRRAAGDDHRHRREPDRRHAERRAQGAPPRAR